MKNYIAGLLALLAVAFAAPGNAQVFFPTTVTLSNQASLSQATLCDGGCYSPGFFPCTGTHGIVHADAVFGGGGSGLTRYYRVKWTISGPINNGDGATKSVTIGPRQIGTDFADGITQSINCDEWGFYDVKAELLPPTGNDVPISSDHEWYEATYRSFLLNPYFQVTKQTCNQWQVSFILNDADAAGHPVKNVPIHVFMSLPKAGGGFVEDTATVVTDQYGTGTVTLIGTGVVMNATCAPYTRCGYFALKHGVLPAGSFPDPYFATFKDVSITGCSTATPVPTSTPAGTPICIDDDHNGVCDY